MSDGPPEALVDAVDDLVYAWVEANSEVTDDVSPAALRDLEQRILALLVALRPA